VHAVWFVDGEYVHMASGAPDSSHEPGGRPVLPIVDVRKPAKPEEVDAGGCLGTRVGDSTPPPARHPKFDSAFAAQHQRLSRAARSRLRRYISAAR